MRAKSIWQLGNTDEKAVELLVKELGLSRVVAGILVIRGIATPEAAKEFLYAGKGELRSPLEIPGLQAGAKRIYEAIRNKESILVYGDYDVDGITGTVLLTDLLRCLGAQVRFYIPGRMDEGYGLNSEAIRQARETGSDLLVTVDCGISSRQEIALARELGMDVVITDHHEPPELLPEAQALINPKLATLLYEEGSCPWYELAGVGVAYKVGQQVAFLCGQEDLSGEYLDLVALGTIADIVPLCGENRILVKEGLARMSEFLRPGLQALVEVSNISGPVITEEQVGYILAPRLNACGRMSKADLAVELLMIRDTVRARELAQLLDKENQARQTIEGRIVEEAQEIIDSNKEIELHKCLVLASQEWHPGVIGIVASRLVGKYHRPTLLIAIENGIGKGSGRSIPGFSLHQALEQVKEYLLTFGGHEMAAGFSLEEAQIPSFKEAFQAVVDQSLQADDLLPVLQADVEIDCRDINAELVRELALLAPFGQRNPRPLLVVRKRPITGCREVGSKGNHLKLRVMGENSWLEGIAFQKGVLKEIAAGWDICDVAFSPEINTWNGRTMVQLNIKDLKPYLEPDNPTKPVSFLDRLYLEGEIWQEDDYYRDYADRAEFYTKVAGVSFENRQEVIRTLSAGDKVELRREPANAHDPKAVAVYCREGQLGYLKGSLARYLAPAMEQGIEYEAYVTQVTGYEKNNLGVNLRVGRLDREKDFSELTVVRKRWSSQSPPELERMIKEALLGSHDYHPKQREALEGLRKHVNSLVVFGTGRGKSAVFQAMAAYLALTANQATLIIYPLRSLVNDQYRHLQEKLEPMGLRVASANGSLNMAQKKEFFKDLLAGTLDVILTTPEFLEYHVDKFAACKEKIGLFVVDEAHHLAQAKRKGYRTLPRNWRRLDKPLALAVTATADDHDALGIAHDLEVGRVIIDEFTRANLQVVDRRNEKDKLAYLLQLLARGERVVIYVNSRKQAYQLADDLRFYYPPGREEIGFYHGGLSSEDRITLEEMFRLGKLRVMVTTSAFGEGINIPDIKHVVLYHLCFSRTEFNQLSGRAGRNHEDAYIHLLFGDKDKKLNELILEGQAPNREMLVHVYRYLRERAREADPVLATNHEIMEAIQREGMKNFREQTASASLAILEELGLLLREVEGNKRYIHIPPPPPGKLDLGDSVRYLEGMDEWEEFLDFSGFALKGDSAKLLDTINKPIAPKNFVL